ncbi:hypothetical protein [Halorussus marinus]|uniref:hypothetical protein n=1 Tax=Halorussus marinus TaxID=2505976 RepID=UPI00106E641A|nr:hypothetical protein [Halorussus marinus]
MPEETTDIVDRVVRTVYYQTSPTQPDRIPAHKVVMILAGNGSEDEFRVRRALDDAVEVGRLERDEDHVWLPDE